MKKWLFLWIIFSDCSERVVHFTSPKAPFDSYKTFSLTNLKTNRKIAVQDGEDLFANIESSIISEMTRRDYKANNIAPDLIVRYELISAQIVENINNQYSYAPQPISSARTIEQYALLIELIDPKKSSSIWQASMDLSKYKSVKNKADLIAKATTSLFNTYLQKAGSGNTHPELDLSKKK